MWKVLVIAGGILTAAALYYFIQLAYYLMKSYTFSDYGYGVLTGNVILLLTGLLLLRLGFRMKKKKEQRM